MILTSDDLLKLVHSTKSFSVWNRDKGPVFWYALGVPGPFYINVECIIGKVAAEKLLQDITDIIAAIDNLEQRSSRLNDVVMDAYANNEIFQNIIATMADCARAEFDGGAYSFISGGERRDWFFSIPLARELGLKHLFLFKDKNLYCAQPVKSGENGIHIADLINNAASYIDAWLPILNKAQLNCLGTLCVIARGNGAQKLTDMGIKVVPLQKIDLGFFEKSLAMGLIDRATLNEIASHFVSPAGWAETYLMSKPEILALELDKKSYERIRSFFTQDPWQLRPKHPDLFRQIERELADRKRA